MAKPVAVPTAAGHAKRVGRSMEVETDADGRPRRILKSFDENEFAVYSRLASEFTDDPVHELIPAFHGERQHVLENGECYRHLCIDNVLLHFSNPKVMDVKIGVRTFLEQECECTDPRCDLFGKMVKKFPSALTAEENESKAVTKHRYLMVTDAQTTTVELGYRIEGIAGYRRNHPGSMQEELVAIQSREASCEAFMAFAEIAASDDGQTADGASSSDIASQIQQNIAEFARVLGRSEFFRDHECIGTSILIVADTTGKVGTFWIDFAKTYPCMQKITHTSCWERGNHEDGVLRGVDNLVLAWAEVANTLCSRDSRLGRAHSRTQSVQQVKLNGPMIVDEDFSDISLLASLPSLNIEADMLAKLAEEVRIGACTLTKQIDSPGVIKRSTRIAVLQLKRQDGRVLAQMGKRTHDGKLTVMCRYPGTKVKKGRDARSAVQEFIQEKLQHLAEAIEIYESEDVVETKTSVNFGIDTEYSETIFYAEMRDDLSGLPVLGRERLEWASQCHDLFHWQLPVRNTVYRVTVATPDGSMNYFFSWLTLDDFEECRSISRQDDVRAWLSMLQIQPQPKVGLSLADCGLAVLRAAMAEDSDDGAFASGSISCSMTDLQCLRPKRMNRKALNGAT
jgi:1D-myo-inositol-triphosphate 3-kinase